MSDETGSQAKDVDKADEAAAAVEFQKTKDYGYQKTSNRSVQIEQTEVDPSFTFALPVLLEVESLVQLRSRPGAVSWPAYG